MKNKKALLFILIVLGTFIFCYSLWHNTAVYRYNQVNYTEISSQNGVWDLREIDFETTVVRLKGDVEHIPNMMLTPENFDDYAHLIEIGNPLDANEGRTARLTLLMPDSETYHLHGRGDYARKYFVNGDFVWQMGIPSENADDFVPAYGELSVNLKALDNQLQFIIQGGNFVHREGSEYSWIFVGSPELLTWFVDIVAITEAIVVGMLILLFVIHLLLSCVFGNRKINLMFSILCLVFAVRLSMVGSKIIYELLPSFPWELAIKAEYFTVALSSLLLLEMLNLQFENIFDKRVICLGRVVFGILSLLSIFGSTFLVSNLLIPLTVSYTTVLVYLIVGICRHFYKIKKEKMPIALEHIISTISMLVLLFAAIFDSLYYTAVFTDINSSTAEIAILFYSITMTFAVFLANMKLVEDAKIAEMEARLYANGLEQLGKMKSEFLQDISHEMKTPLTVISTGSDFIELQIAKGDVGDDTLAKAISTVKNEADKLGKMIGGMIDMEAMMTTENRQKFHLPDLISSVMQPFSLIAKQNGIHIVYDIAQEMPSIYAEYNSIATVIGNIMKNAIEHSKCTTILCRVWSGVSDISVLIRDNGTGIDNQILPNITKRGVTNSEGGNGLGLHICKTVIDAHGGEFSIESNAQGTSVLFKLPHYSGQEEGH